MLQVRTPRSQEVVVQADLLSRLPKCKHLADVLPQPSPEVILIARSLGYSLSILILWYFTICSE